MAKVIFYCRDKTNSIESLEYYRQDIEALRDLGHQVTICTRYSQIPLKFDVLFIWWWTYALWPVLLAKVVRSKSIVTGTFNFRHKGVKSALDYFNRPFWQRALIRSAIVNADLNMMVSKVECNECASYFQKARLMHYPHSVGSEYHIQPPVNRTNRLLNIAWSGRLNLQRKGVFDLVAAVGLLVKRGVDVKLTLAGKRGDGYDYLRTLIHDSGAESAISLVGEVTKEHKIELLGTHGIYVQPSYYEGFGLATAEAMACAACVITCDVGEVRHVVGDCAVYVPSGDVKALADAIQKAVENDAYRTDFQRRAQARMATHYSYAVKLDSLRQALLSLGIRSPGAAERI